MFYRSIKERKYNDDKDISGCSISGLMSENRKLMSGHDVLSSIAVMHDRGNGLGGGFAAYGIYPELKRFYAFHIMYDSDVDKEETEIYLKRVFNIELLEEIPTRKTEKIYNPPLLWRYFMIPKTEHLNLSELSEDDFVVQSVMTINQKIKGAFVFSSGKNMGTFKAVGFPEDVGLFYKLDEYRGYTWIAHGRFPTNSPGWWGGAHPFTILDWAIVHNGEISSYGINKRYLEMYGYHCTLQTDTEVAAYLFDLLLRKQGLPIEVACQAFAANFWEEIDRQPAQKRELLTAIRQIYGSALINGPFAIILGHKNGMIGLNDRIKLRPLVAARKEDMFYIASEEAGIREICPNPEKVWMPKAGEPIFGFLKKEKDIGQKSATA